MKSVFVLLSVAAAALAAPQNFDLSKFLTAPIVGGAPQYTFQKAVAPHYTFQKAAIPQYTIQKTASPVYQQYDPKYFSQKAAAAPTIVNFGLERTHPDQGELIIRQTQTHDADGTYSVDVELEKGIKINEQGYLKNAGTDAEAQVAQGQYSYVGDDGQTYTVSYIADENGFQPQGSHLPTPPPIPAELAQAIALAKADPNYKETDE